jgi:hypothetical protein
LLEFAAVLLPLPSSVFYPNIDGDGGRRGLGLRGQRRGTESIVAEMVERRERNGGDQLLGDTDLRLAFKPLCDWLGAARLICSPANGGAFDDRGNKVRLGLSADHSA